MTTFMKTASARNPLLPPLSKGDQGGFSRTRRTIPEDRIEPDTSGRRGCRSSATRDPRPCRRDSPALPRCAAARRGRRRRAARPAGAAPGQHPPADLRRPERRGLLLGRRHAHHLPGDPAPVRLRPDLHDEPRRQRRAPRLHRHGPHHLRLLPPRRQALRLRLDAPRAGTPVRRRPTAARATSGRSTPSTTSSSAPSTAGRPCASPTLPATTPRPRSPRTAAASSSPRCATATSSCTR